MILKFSKNYLQKFLKEFQQKKKFHKNHLKKYEMFKKLVGKTTAFHR